jgi:hypothetical protein
MVLARIAVRLLQLGAKAVLKGDPMVLALLEANSESVLSALSAPSAPRLPLNLTTSGVATCDRTVLLSPRSSHATTARLLDRQLQHQQYPPAQLEAPVPD